MAQANGLRSWLRGVTVLSVVVLQVALGAEDGRTATIHADQTLPADCAGTYNPATRSCGSGSAVAYRTLAGAASAAQAGDTVLLRGGTYGQALTPPRSGTAAAYITYRNYPGETPTISGIGDVAISLLNRNYLVVEGLTVADSTGWGRVESSNYNIFRGNHFLRAQSTGTTGGLKFVKAAYNKVQNNTFDEGNDSITVQESDRNLIEGNTVTKARHSLLSVRCGNYNVIRGNVFHNADQKAAEIYDCEGTSDAPVKLDATKHNLFDLNAFTFTRADAADYRYNAIQYGGQNGIVRRNVFYENQGGGVNFQIYADESLYNYGHRVFNNTFFNNRCYAVAASGDTNTARYYGNLVKNNILYRNVSCSGAATQTGVGNTTAVRLESNAVTTSSPGFASEAGHDFRLAAGSPMIDAGAFATKTSSAGSGTTMTVDDAGYFFDGFGIPGEAGDTIQLEGQTATATVLAINYVTRALTLDRSLAWTAGQNVHLRYAGARPDQGAYEFGTAAGGVAPYPPTNLRVLP